MDAMLDTGESFARRSVRPSPESKQAWHDFKLSRASLMADMMAAMRQQPAFNYDFVSQSSEQFANAIESALRLDAPELLNQTAAWQWTPRPPNGPSVLHLEQQTGIIAQAVQQRIPVASRSLVATCVDNMGASMRIAQRLDKLLRRISQNSQINNLS